MRKLLSCAALAWGVAVLTAPATADDKAQPGKGQEKLEGGYTIVSGEEGGKPVPAEDIKGSIVRFTGDRIIGTDKDRKEFFAAKYRLDTAQKPWVIHMTSTEPKEAKSTGLIKKEGDTVTIIYSLPGVPAPTDFKTTQKGQHLFVMKAMKERDKK